MVVSQDCEGVRGFVEEREEGRKREISDDDEERGRRKGTHETEAMAADVDFFDRHLCCCCSLSGGVREEREPRGMRGRSTT